MRRVRDDSTEADQPASSASDGILRRDRMTTGYRLGVVLFSSFEIGILKSVLTIRAAESKERILDTNRIVEELKQERARLDRAIAALDGPASPKVVARKARVAAQQPVALQ